MTARRGLPDWWLRRDRLAARSDAQLARENADLARRTWFGRRDTERLRERVARARGQHAIEGIGLFRSGCRRRDAQLTIGGLGKLVRDRHRAGRGVSDRSRAR